MHKESFIAGYRKPSVSIVIVIASLGQILLQALQLQQSDFDLINSILSPILQYFKVVNRFFSFSGKAELHHSSQFLFLQRYRQ